MHCFTVPHVLEPGECRQRIARAEAAGFGAAGLDHPPSYRDDDRRISDEPAFAERLFERLRDRLPATLDEPGARWRLLGLNPRLRCCRFVEGQRFARRRDGARFEGPDVRSFLTAEIFLNDGQFEGGRMRYFRDRWCPEPSLAVTPRAGTALVFDHRLWHDAEPVTGGRKYVLRSDVLYKRVWGPRPEGHLGYVLCLAELADGRLASGSRDATVRIWSGERVEQILEGHEASVTCLLPVDGDLWSGSRDRTLRMWRSGRVLRGHRGAVLALARRSDGTVASAGADGRLCLWSPEGSLLRTLKTTAWPGALCPGPEGELVVGGDDGSLQTVQSGERHLLDSAVRSLLLVDGRLLTGCADGSIRGLGSGHRGAVTCLARTGDGRILTGGEDDRVLLWEGPEPEELLRHDDFVTALCALGDGTVASASYDGTVRRTPLPPLRAGRG